ncbi:MAG: diphthine--ammonia ligase [Candidatus Thermoplasmatota archaeon]|nr:diphthine--ammonia ligase [Candidatus Thermoplasmatota archaeon]
MKVAVLLSGGKDSVYAAFIARQWGWDISHAVVVRPRSLSWMYHTDNIHLTADVARSMGLPLVARSTHARPEEELAELQSALAGLDVDGVVSGAVASEYQRTRIERVCHSLDIKSFTPLWHKDGRQLLQEMLQAGFAIVVVAVAAEGLGGEWLGRVLDGGAVEELVGLHGRYGIHVAGEGGEYETLVLDCPLYSRRLVIEHSEKRWDGSRGTLHVDRLETQPKP